MIKKTSKLLFTVLLYISIPVTHAATMTILDTDKEAVQLINKQANTFTDLSPDLPEAEPDPKIKHPFSPPNSEVYMEFENSGSASAYNLKSFSEKLISKYADNILVQDSLNSLYEAKLLWDELDALATDFSYDVLFNLKLDQFVEFDPYYVQKPRNYQYDKVNTDIYDKVKRVQKANKNKATNNYQESTDDFITYLLRKQTLYYLLGLFILFVLLQKLIKFLLRLFP